MHTRGRVVADMRFIKVRIPHHPVKKVLKVEPIRARRGEEVVWDFGQVSKGTPVETFLFFPDESLFGGHFINVVGRRVALPVSRKAGAHKHEYVMFYRIGRAHGFALGGSNPIIIIQP